AKPFKQGVDVPQIVARAGRRPARHALVITSDKEQVGAAPPPEPDPAPRPQLALARRLAVHVGAVPRGLVPEQIAAALARDFRMLARHFAAAQTQVVGFAPADRERPVIHGHDALTEHVAYF